MWIGFLGPLEIVDGGICADIGGPRQQRVLACLLVSTPDFVTVDRLIDEVWGERAPATAAHVISTYVSSLRKTLGSRIVSERTRHRIDVSADEVDAVMFAERLEMGRSLVDSDPTRALLVLDGAIGLWKGRPFGELADESALLCLHAESLIELQVQAVEARVRAALDLGHHERVVPVLRTLTQEHPYRERLWQQLMLALYRGDRQGEALRAGHELRTLLRDELGIEPSQTTQDLEQRILVQDPELLVGCAQTTRIRAV